MFSMTLTFWQLSENVLDAHHELDSPAANTGVSLLFTVTPQWPAAANKVVQDVHHDPLWARAPQYLAAAMELYLT